MGGAMAFTNLGVLAEHLRQELKTKKFILIYAYNGTGKTRLSTAFKDLGKVVNTDDEAEQQDTLYFNAFTEDLFSWDNDLENDSERKLTLNTDSSFFAGLESMEMDNRIRTLLDRYADFEFRIDTTTWEVIFAREFRVKKDGTVGDEVDSADAGQGTGEYEYETRREEAIKISRGEENIFIWCFFLAILQLALDDDGTESVQVGRACIYIDDPISSLDEHNAIVVGKSPRRSCYKRGAAPDQDGRCQRITPRSLTCCALRAAEPSGRAVAVHPQAGTDRRTAGYLLADARPAIRRIFLPRRRVGRSLARWPRDGQAARRIHFNMLRARFWRRPQACSSATSHFSECIKKRR